MSKKSYTMPEIARLPAEDKSQLYELCSYHSEGAEILNAFNVFIHDYDTIQDPAEKEACRRMLLGDAFIPLVIPGSEETKGSCVGFVGKEKQDIIYQYLKMLDLNLWAKYDDLDNLHIFLVFDYDKMVERNLVGCEDRFGRSRLITPYDPDFDVTCYYRRKPERWLRKMLEEEKNPSEPIR